MATALGYAKPQNTFAGHIDNEDKKVALIQGTPGGRQYRVVINESGLYSLILSSKLPNAGSLLGHTEGQQILDLLPLCDHGYSYVIWLMV